MPHNPESHVVTIGLEFCDGREPAGFTCEVYRGDEVECRVLRAAISGCSHDQRRISDTLVRCDTIKDWEAFVHAHSYLAFPPGPSPEP